MSPLWFCVPFPSQIHWDGDWELGLEIGIGVTQCPHCGCVSPPHPKIPWEWKLGLEIGIGIGVGNWDWGQMGSLNVPTLVLCPLPKTRPGIGNWDWKFGLGSPSVPHLGSVSPPHPKIPHWEWKLGLGSIVIPKCPHCGSVSPPHPKIPHWEWKLGLVIGTGNWDWNGFGIGVKLGIRIRIGI